MTEQHAPQPLSRCRELRLARGLTAERLGVLSGATADLIYRLEKCQTRGELGRMKVGSLMKIAETLGVSVCELVPSLEALS